MTVEMSLGSLTLPPIFTGASCWIVGAGKSAPLFEEGIPASALGCAAAVAESSSSAGASAALAWARCDDVGCALSDWDIMPGVTFGAAGFAGFEGCGGAFGAGWGGFAVFAALTAGVGELSTFIGATESTGEFEAPAMGSSLAGTIGRAACVDCETAAAGGFGAAGPLFGEPFEELSVE